MNVSMWVIASMAAMAMEGFDFDLTGESIRRDKFDASFRSTKVQRHNEELHKTSAYLSEQARATERSMERARYRR